MIDERERAGIDELYAYTIGLGDPAFLHQHAVDAFAAQTATEDDKPIRLLMALVGLYLHVERGFTGKQAQQAHVHIAKRKRAWPTFELPERRGTIRVTDVVAVPPGPARDEAIRAWARDVWAAYTPQHDAVGGCLRDWLDL